MKRQFLLTFVLILNSAMLFASTSIAQQKGSAKTSGYHLLKKFETGGEGGWDYLFVDSAARRLYLSRSTHVMVLNADTGASVGDIPNTNGVHGIAIAPDAGKGFTSNGRDGSVSIFDLKTLQVTSTVKVGKNPDAIIYDPASHRVFAFNRGDSSVSAIDAASGAVAGTIPLGGHPEFAASDEAGKVFVNLDDKSEVVAIDARKLEVKSRWSVAPGEDPSGLAIDRKHHHLFSVCGNKKMVVSDYDAGRVLTTLPIGGGVDAAAFDPETNLAFSSNGEGTLTVVHRDSPEQFSVVENVTTQQGARTMALDVKTHNVYLVTAKFGPPPAPTPERPNPRPSIMPNSFVVLVFGK